MMKDVRNNTRCIWDSFEEADRIWQRIKQHIPEAWANRKVMGLNERWFYFIFMSYYVTSSHVISCHISGNDWILGWKMELERASAKARWMNERTNERKEFHIFTSAICKKSHMIILKEISTNAGRRTASFKSRSSTLFFVFLFQFKCYHTFFYLNFTKHFLNWRNYLKYIKTIKEFEQNFEHIFLAVCQLNNWQIIKGFSGWRVPWSGLSCGV